MEKYTLSLEQKENLAGQVKEVVKTAEGLGFNTENPGDISKTIDLLVNLKEGLERLRIESDINELKYDLALRQELAEKLGLDFVGKFNDGLAKAKKDGYCWFIDKDGKKLFPYKRFYWIGEFKEELALVEYYDELGFINKQGEDVTGYFPFMGDFHEGLARVSVGGYSDEQGLFVNKQGERIFDEEDFQEVGNFSEGLVRVKKEDKWYFINKEGKEILNGERFDNAGDFSEALAVVRKNSEWYFINRQGEDVFGECFDGAGDFFEGLAGVQKENRRYFINKKGKDICNGQRFNDAGNFSEGLARVKKDNEWYFINKEGENICDGQRFDNVGDFSDGLARVMQKNKAGKNRWYFINKKGEDICNGQRFNEVKNFEDGVAEVTIDGENTFRSLYIDTYGNRIFSKEKNKEK